MSPILSVVVPTHNRACYAIHAISALLDIPDSNFEIVISDTSTDGGLYQLLHDPSCNFLKDKRLNYFRPSNKLDMTGNHNAAVAAATGDYVCLIGDDDTITSDAIVAATWAKKHNIEVIAPNVVANYVWPDFRSRFLGSRHASRLYFAKNLKKTVIHDSSTAIEKALHNAAQGTDGLPKIYHGIVKRSLLEKLHKQSGAYFHGSSPDVSGAIALALCCKSFLVVDYPLTIPGASGGSNTGRSAMNTHKGKLNEESQTKHFEGSGWSLGVPQFFSVETVWAHAALTTLEHLSPHLLERFNYSRLIAICLVLHPEYSNEIAKATIEAQNIMGCTAAALHNRIKVETKRYRRERLTHLIKRLLVPTAAGGRSYVGNLDTIAQAPDALAQYVKQKQLNWGQSVSNHSNKTL